MGSRSIMVDINPKVLQWARESIGYSVEELAKKMGENPATINSWEDGSEKISYSKLKIFAQKTHRSTTTLLLDEPPEEDEFPTDFRIHEDSNKFNKYDKLLLAIRTARDHQLAFKDLFGDSEPSPFRSLPKLQIGEDPEKAAIRVRNILNIPIETQMDEWKDNEEAYIKWKGILESYNILVFQEAWDKGYGRAFSLYDDTTPVIMINSKDVINGKIFSLMHEFGHILLNNGGICDPGRIDELEHDGEKSDEKAKIEIYCNHFAGAFLVPIDPLITYHRTRYLKGHTEIHEERLENIASDFKVSKEVILRRLLVADKVSNHWYRTMRNKWKNLPEKSPQGGGGGGRNMPEECLNHNGHKFTKLVISAYHKDKIPLSEVGNLLNIKVPHFEKLEKIASGEK